MIKAKRVDDHEMEVKVKGSGSEIIAEFKGIIISLRSALSADCICELVAEALARAEEDTDA